MRGCGDFDGLGAGAGVSHALGSVDCHVDAAVAGAYGRLFGAGGAFSLALTILLTLYVAFIALGLITGRTRLTLAGLTPRILAIGLVLTFATSWPAYQALAYGLLVGGPEDIVRQISGPGAGAHAFAGRLDLLFDRFADIAKALGDTAPGSSKALGPLAAPQMASALVWLSGILLLLGAAGALVLTRIVLALLLALGPIFVVLALFRTTRGLFEGWLRTTVMFAVAPLFTVLAGSGAIALLAPLVNAIAEDPAAAVADLRPVLELFMGSVVYVGLMAMLLWTSASLAASWRIFDRSGDGGDARRDGLAASASAATSPALASRSGSAEPRAAAVAAALERAATGGTHLDTQARAQQVGAIRVETLTPPAPADTSLSPRARDRGLGQRFLAPSPSTAAFTSGAVK